MVSEGLTVALHPYQNRMVEFVMANPKVALWAEMGLGKTVATLTALVDLFDRAEISRVLVVAPLRVAKSTWPAEIVKWPHTRHLSFSVLHDTAAGRRRKLRDGRQIHLINYELLRWLVEELEDCWPYDCVVFDEASKMKASGTKRYRAFRRVAPKTERIIELTGTPAANGLLDLWAQIYLLDRGQRLGRTFTAYQQRFFQSDYMGYNFTPLPGAEPEIHLRLSDICQALRAEDYLKMPDLLPTDIMVELPPAAMASYRVLERAMLLELGDQVITAATAAVLSNKCVQAANGALYAEDGTWAPLHDAKLDALEDVIDEAAGHPVLVAFWYKSDLERLQKRFPRGRVLDTKEQTIRDWNAGRIPLLFAHPASAGHGLNLQAGGNILVWFSLTWSLELYQQFNARLHRQGQTRPVFLYHLVGEDTMDERVLRVLQGKASVQDALMEAVSVQDAA